MSCAVWMRAMLPFQPLTWASINSSSRDDNNGCELLLCFLSDAHRPEGGENHLDKWNAIHNHEHVQEAVNAQH